MNIETTVTVTAVDEATLGAALIAAGILVPGESGYAPRPPTIHSALPPNMAGQASAFIRFETETQAQADAVLAIIGTEAINRPAAPLAQVAGGLAPKPEAWPPEAIELALVRLDLIAAWDAAIALLSTKADATLAEKAIPVRWKHATYLTFEEGWVLRILAQMRTTLGWTPAERNQKLQQIKTRATAAMGDV